MKPSVKETVLFGMLGALMFASKLLMDSLPNIHLIGVFVVALTVVYRKKALYPIYIFVLITGLLGGFASWWFSYLYIWTVLWTAVMLLPKKMPKPIQPIIYMSVCALHGFLYSVLYVPVQAVFFGLNFEGMIAWLISGIPYDITHGISNFFCGILICPIIAILQNSQKYVNDN